jgi:hypothetical protein
MSEIFYGGQGGSSKWDHAEQDWNTALERAGNDQTKALGILVALAVDRLEDVKTGVTNLSDKLDAQM